MTNAKVASRYLSVLAGGIIGVMAVNASVVSIIDPMGYFCTYESASLNKNRYFAIGDRLSRSLRLKYGDFETIYYGASRTQTGLPTETKWFDDASTYNASLPGTNMYELQEVVYYSLKYQNPDTVIFAIDFVAFSSKRETNFDFGSSLFASEWNIAPALARYVFSYDSLKRSVDTVLANRKGGNPSGSNEMNNCDGSRVVFELRNQREIFEAGLSTMYERGGVYNCYDYSEDRLERLRSTLVALLESGTSVALYISPIHAFHLLGIEAAGLLPAFNQWRSDVSDIVRELQNDPELGNRLIAAWDFTPPLGVNAEPIPSLPDELMIGYFDSGHHTPWVGQKVIGSLMENRLIDDQLQGSQLGIPTNDANFSLLNEQLDHYKVKHPEAVTEVNRIYNKYSPKTACFTSQ